MRGADDSEEPQPLACAVLPGPTQAVGRIPSPGWGMGLQDEAPSGQNLAVCCPLHTCRGSCRHFFLGLRVHPTG